MFLVCSDDVYCKIEYSKSYDSTIIPFVDRVGREIGALLRRLGIPYHRKDSRLRINGVSLKNWFQPKLATPFSGGKPGNLRSSQVPLGNQISRQQRSIRLGNLSLE